MSTSSTTACYDFQLATYRWTLTSSRATDMFNRHLLSAILLHRDPMPLKKQGFPTWFETGDDFQGPALFEPKAGGLKFGS